MDRPIDVEPGDHFLSVTKAGYGSLGKSIMIERDREAPTPRVDLIIGLASAGLRVAF